MPRRFSAFLLVLLANSVYAADTKEVDVSAASAWVDTGVDVKPGDTLAFTATGTVAYQGNNSTPDGLARAWMDLVAQLPVNSSGKGALVGRFGDSPAARAFLVGAKSQHAAPIAGRLFLSINQMSAMPGSGSYHVVITHTAAPTSQSTAAAAPISPITQAMLDSIPPRVNDASGNVGDRVNFILVGSEDKVQTALSGAGWVVVDKTKKDAVLHGLITSFSKDAYVTLPMSELQLFGRVQDYGYAQGDPLKVVASRHHFRIWKCPFTAGGETVWAGAGTHDIGFDRDNRNNGITHKIDPATDGERDYIGQSLQQTGLVVKEEYLTPTHPVMGAKTATGSGFTSDGRTIVIYLQPDGHNYGQDFAGVFCSVLAANPDTGEWGACGQYLEGAAAVKPATLGALDTKYHVVIVPGFLSSCFSETPAFSKGQKSLQTRNVVVDLIPVPNDASSANAKLIATTLHTMIGKDPRKVILVGYSKGSPDIYEMLTTNPDLRGNIAAFISVAGAIGGSPVADTIPGQADQWIQKFNMKGCQGDINSGFKSLSRSVRQAYLNANPSAGVPTYSIVAQSTKDSTSTSLMESWTILGSMGSVEDGQLLKPDAIVPESKFLGGAIADHFAIALPFEDSTDGTIKKGMNKNHYPRAALLEALVRFVEADLK